MAFSTTQCHHKAPPPPLPLSTLSLNPPSLSSLSFSSHPSHHKLSLSNNYSFGYGKAQFKIRPKAKVLGFCHFFFHALKVFDISIIILHVLIWDHSFFFLVFNFFMCGCVARIGGYVCAKCAIESYDLWGSCFRQRDSV